MKAAHFVLKENPMPLLDHFRPPLESTHHWDSFHSNWATRLADQLNDRLPEGFLAEETTHADGRAEIDVATYEQASGVRASPNGGTTAALSTWAPPAPPRTM